MPSTILLGKLAKINISRVRPWKMLFLRNFDQKSKSRQKYRNWSPFDLSKIFATNRNSGQKSKFSPKIEMLVKNRNSGQQSKF